MTQVGVVSQFTDVDRSADTGWFVKFMDTVNALPEYVIIRRELIAALEIVPGSVVLDAGCGTGDDARQIAAVVEASGQVVGLDSSAAMVQTAEVRNAGEPIRPTFQLGELTALPFDDQTFDAVMAKLVLMHTPDAAVVIAELLRVTKPEGRVAVFDYDVDTTTIDHPDRGFTRKVVRALADAHPGSGVAGSMRRLLAEQGIAAASLRPFVVQMPWPVWSLAVEGRILECQRTGALDVTEDELRRWWRFLRSAASADAFHTSITGFLTTATRPR
jgi:ubiquinone/menaquinone biosynthesis C-methylase UbiE